MTVELSGQSRDVRSEINILRFARFMGPVQTQVDRKELRSVQHKFVLKLALIPFQIHVRIY